MAYTLIISEKPSAAAKIAAALGTPIKKANNKIPYYDVTCGGKDLIVVPSVGHLFGLAQKEKSSAYPTFDLEWVPNYEKSKSAAFAKPYAMNIKKLAKSATEFIIATDNDIEGEVIGHNIIQFLCNQKDAKRMKFSTLTKEDLQQSYKTMSDTIDWGQANAGDTRHHLDWYWGINLSKAVTASIISSSGKYATLSIGRVQGPTLAVLAEREISITQFKPKDYWQIYLNLNIQKESYKAFHKAEKVWEESVAKKIFEKVKDKPAEVTNIKKVAQAVNPPVPFDLTTLQTEAYRVFRIAPKQTLILAQDLYTAALISYPRTSSQKLPAQLGFKKLLVKLSQQQEYAAHAAMLLSKKDLIPNEGKKSDPAHPAIYPTGDMPRGLDERQKKIYDLIVKRFFAVFGAPGVRETTSITFSVESEPFILKGTRTVEQGWQMFYQPYVRKEEIDLPLLNKGDKYDQKTSNDKKKTDPPKRYTAASIIRALEKENLGTKATRANIVDTLFQRGYLKGNAIEVTKLGMEVYNAFQNYAPDILNKKLTRQFEDEMEKIRAGQITGAQVLDEAKEILKKLCNKFDLHKKEIGTALSEALTETRKIANTLMTCPNCKVGEIRVIVSKKTKKRFLACNNYPACKTTYPLPQAGKLTILNAKCAVCSTPRIAAYAKGRKPWQFCPNMNCESRKETKPEAVNSKA